MTQVNPTGTFCLLATPYGAAWPVEVVGLQRAATGPVLMSPAFAGLGALRAAQVAQSVAWLVSVSMPQSPMVPQEMALPQVLQPPQALQPPVPISPPRSPLRPPSTAAPPSRPAAPPSTPTPAPEAARKPRGHPRVRHTPAAVLRAWKPTTCALCDVSLLTPLDSEAHLNSREHLRRLQEREQRAILVRGLPADTTPEDLLRMFQDYRLAPDAVTYVSASEADPPSGHWRILLNTVDDARTAAKYPPAPVGATSSVSITLALPPDNCALCNITVTSAYQLQQHRKGHRHRETVKQRATA
eukprot:EG_transcript_21397